MIINTVLAYAFIQYLNIIIFSFRSSREQLRGLFTVRYLLLKRKRYAISIERKLAISSPLFLPRCLPHDFFAPPPPARPLLLLLHQFWNRFEFIFNYYLFLYLWCHPVKILCCYIYTQICKDIIRISLILGIFQKLISSCAFVVKLEMERSFVSLLNEGSFTEMEDMIFSQPPQSQSQPLSMSQLQN